MILALKILIRNALIETFFFGQNTDQGNDDLIYPVIAHTVQSPLNSVHFLISIPQGTLINFEYKSK